MCAFLERAVERIVDAGFVATIGFKDACAKWMSRSLRKRLRAWAANGQYVHQLHHYPSLLDPTRLPRHDSLDIQPCIVGEFATRRHGLGLRGMRWLDDCHVLRGGDPEQYLLRRLEIIERAGYAGALAWSARGKDPMSDWSPSTRAQVRRFIARHDP